MGSSRLPAPMLSEQILNNNSFEEGLQDNIGNNNNHENYYGFGN